MIRMYISKYIRKLKTNNTYKQQKLTKDTPKFKALVKHYISNVVLKKKLFFFSNLFADILSEI